jgi:hypothetical protein
MKLTKSEKQHIKEARKANKLRNQQTERMTEMKMAALVRKFGIKQPEGHYMLEVLYSEVSACKNLKVVPCDSAGRIGLIALDKKLLAK